MEKVFTRTVLSFAIYGFSMPSSFGREEENKRSDHGPAPLWVAEGEKSYTEGSEYALAPPSPVVNARRRPKTAEAKSVFKPKLNTTH